MSLLHLDFKSTALRHSTSLYAIIPEVTENFSRDQYQVLYLLHGMGDDYTKWVRRTNIEQYVRNYQLVVISAGFANSFYTNMKHGDDYWTFLTEELPSITNKLFSISHDRKDHFVAGMSMGGCGAFKWAINKPEMFEVAGSFSGVLDPTAFFNDHDKGLLTALHLTGSEHYLKDVYDQVWGHGTTLAKTKNDLSWLLTHQQDQELPELYQYCGTEDPILQFNQKFADTADSLPSIRHNFYKSPGHHDWNYWDSCIHDFLEKLPLRMAN